MTNPIKSWFKWTLVCLVTMFGAGCVILEMNGMLGDGFFTAYMEAEKHPCRITYAKAVNLVRGGAYADALPLLEEAAQADNPQACTLIYLLLKENHLKSLSNHRTVYADQALAGKWLQRALELGEPEAFFIKATNDPKDNKEAIKWLMLAEMMNSKKSIQARLWIELLRIENNLSRESRLVLNAVKIDVPRRGDVLLAEAAKQAEDYLRQRGVRPVNGSHELEVIKIESAHLALSIYMSMVGVATDEGTGGVPDFLKHFLPEDFLFFAASFAIPDAKFLAAKCLAFKSSNISKALNDKEPSVAIRGSQFSAENLSKKVELKDKCEEELKHIRIRINVREGLIKDSQKISGRLGVESMSDRFFSELKAMREMEQQKKSELEFHIHEVEAFERQIEDELRSLVSRKKEIDSALLSYLKNAAKHGSFMAQATLAVRCKKGASWMPVDLQEGCFWSQVIEGYPSSKFFDNRPLKLYLNEVDSELMRKCEADAREFISQMESASREQLELALRCPSSFP